MMLGQSGDAISSPVGQQQAVALAVPLEDVADVAAASDIVEVVGTATHVTAEDYSLLGKVGGGGKPMRQVRFPGQGVPRWTPEEIGKEIPILVTYSYLCNMSTDLSIFCENYGVIFRGEESH